MPCLVRYMKSEFNNCKIEPLKMMYTAVIPIHLKARVKADLDRDVQLGSLDKVNVNSPVKWLSHMTVSLKKGRFLPRQLIHYKRSNNAFPRQTNITKSLFRIPV